MRCTYICSGQYKRILTAPGNAWTPGHGLTPLSCFTDRAQVAMLSVGLLTNRDLCPNWICQISDFKNERDQ